MLNLNIGYYICDTVGFLRVMYLIKLLLNIIRFVVPILLIAMVVKDLYLNMINPDAKEGVPKITKRILAAVIVFFVPMLIDLVLFLVDYIAGNKSDSDYSASSCYTNANRSCIDNIESYLNCDGIKDTTANKNCQKKRRCNEYTLSGDCNVKIKKIDDCKSINDEVTGYE